MSMFYTEAILSRRGALAHVWLAAHYERKLSKTVTLQTDIGQSVGAIVNQEMVPMALRLSGQLLLGVVRIYSRKAKYLLDDCNEAMMKIKLAFRPGVVDMTEEQLAVNRNAITLTGENWDAEFMMPDMAWDVPVLGQQHVARQQDITLSTAYNWDIGLSDDPFGDFGVPGIGSQDWDVDPGLSFGDDENQKEPTEGDEVASVEVGRRAEGLGSPRLSIDTALRGRGEDRDMSVFSKDHHSAVDFGADIGGDFGPNDFNMEDVNIGGINFGDDIEGPEAPLDREKTPTLAQDSRASSPLTPLPSTPPPQLDSGSLPTPTPRTAARLVDLAQQRDAASKKKKNSKKQIVDEVTELKDGPGARGRRGLGDFKDPDVSSITTQQQFLPRSRTVMRLLEIRADPIAYFIPTVTTPEGNFFNAGPPGMAPELASMFYIPVPDHRRSRMEEPADPNPRAPKKPRTTEEDDEASVQMGRRAGSEAGFGVGSEILGGQDNTADFVGGLDDYAASAPDITFDTGAGFDPMDIDAGDININLEPQAPRKPQDELVDDTRSTPGIQIDDINMDTYETQSYSIGVFDLRSKSGETQSQIQENEEIERSTEESQSKGYSKNTVKAIAVVRKGLEAETGEDKYLSFNKVSEKASRRAASAFFFELLVLGTRDCVKLTQSAPFENIEIRGKEKLWEASAAPAPAPVPSTRASVAP